MFTSLLTIICYFLTLHEAAYEFGTHYYYISAHSGNHFQNMSNNKCMPKGSYLPSIPSSRHNDRIMDECASVATYCWIGLVITNGTFSWIDGTNIDTLLINQSLCNASSNIDSNLEYMGYLNSKDECWEITSNMSLKIWGACGPQVFDPSGTYFICLSIIPGLLSLFTFAYSIYCIVYLFNHLFIIRDYNYVDARTTPSLLLKITAIVPPVLLTLDSLLFCIISIMLYTAYRQTGILRPAWLIDTYYPDVYTYIGILMGISGIIYLIYLPTGYTHVCYVCLFLKSQM